MAKPGTGTIIPSIEEEHAARHSLALSYPSGDLQRMNHKLNVPNDPAERSSRSKRMVEAVETLLVFCEAVPNCPNPPSTCR